MASGKIDRARLGRWGEDTACAFLQFKGLKVLKRNYKTGRLEIDIIAEDGRELVFVEVKVRCRDDFGGPWAAVDWRKQREITRVAAGYMLSECHSDRGCRFDVVGIVVDENALGMRLRHVKNAFDASRHLGLYF